MKIAHRSVIFWLFILFAGPLPAQDSASGEALTTPLFRQNEPLEITLNYSNRDLLKETNDSTYLNTVLTYREGEGTWDSIPVRIRARGNYRKSNCFLSPIKIRIKKKDAKGTLFEGNKELKVVLPCFDSEKAADYVLKEYLAYQLYSHITPFHFKTRRAKILYTDERKRKDKAYELEAFFIEDIDRVADRNQGDKLKRSVHPLQQDDICSIENDFFQFMIANTDFSTAYQHNQKLIFVDGRKAIPVPYDFDMSGWVDTNYAVVSQINDEQLEIDEVTDRLYRGFKRDGQLYQATRDKYLAKEAELFECLAQHESDFRYTDSYQECRSFLSGFFRVLKNDRDYRSEILAKARTE